MTTQEQYLFEHMEEFKKTPPVVLTEISDDDFINSIDANIQPENIAQNTAIPDRETEIEETLINSLNNGANEADPETVLSELVDPEDATELLDIAMSGASVVAAKAMKLKYNDSDFEASGRQKKTLEKAVKKALDYVKVTKINPVWMLLITVIIIYGTKLGKMYVSQKMLDEAEEKGYERAKSEFKPQPPPRDENGHFIKKKETRGRPKGSTKK